MTISSETYKHTYNGDNSTTGFAFSFPIFDEAHLLVELYNETTGVVTTQTITTHYTVSGTGNDASQTNYTSGTVTFVTAPTTNDKVIIRRTVPLKQETDYTEYDAFPAETHEDALDELTMIAQDLDERVSRGIAIDPISSVSGTISGLPVAGYGIKLNSGATGLEWSPQPYDISALNALSSLDTTNDYVTVWDNSASTHKKVSINDLGLSTAVADLGSFSFDTTQVPSASEDNYVLTYDNATGLISLEAASGGGGGGISNVVEDTTPQLGGNLDLNSNNITGTGNIDITGTYKGTDLTLLNTGTIAFRNSGDSADDVVITHSTNNLAFTGVSGAGTYSFDHNIDITGNIVVSGTVDGRDIATDGTKLDGIESNATADQTGAEIKTAYEGEADTNAFTDAEQTKLSGIETSADVTDEANVKAALDGATLTAVAVSGTDKVLVQDASDTDNLKTVTAQSIADLAADTNLTQEEVEDFAGALVATGGTKTGITVTYQDATGDMDFVIDDTTVAGDTGSTGITPGDTLTIAGGTEITTAMSGDTLTINSDFTPSSTDTLTNKTFDANGTGNSLSNVDVADLAAGTDGELITWDASGNPTTVAVGTSGHVLTSNGTGAAPTFQAGGGFTAATQAEQETATSTTVGVTPGRQQYHPSAAKCWVTFNGTGTISEYRSYNVTSLVDNATGDYTVNIATDMSDANYAVFGSVSNNGSLSGMSVAINSSGSSTVTAPVVGSFRCTVVRVTTGLVDCDYVTLGAFGDQ